MEGLHVHDFPVTTTKPKEHEEMQVLFITRFGLLSKTLVYNWLIMVGLFILGCTIV